MVTKNITQSILQNLPEKTTRLSEHINTKLTHKIQTFDLFIQRTKKSRGKKNILYKTQNKYKQRVILRGLEY